MAGNENNMNQMAAPTMPQAGFLQQMQMQPLQGVGKFGSTADNSAMAREMAEIQAKVFMAKNFPRDMEAVKNTITANCSRMEMARSAVYQYPRGGQTVTGPSIRLAEMLALAFGNIESKTEVLDQNREQSLVKVSAWDYESNRQSSRTFVVKHERDTKYGRTPLTDNRDIMEMINNQASRNRRACILELIPADYVDYAVGVCSQTLQSNINLTQEMLSQMVEGYQNNFGVTKEMLEARIGSRVEAITIQKFLELDRIFASLRDGVGKPADFFDMDIGKKKDEDKDDGRKNSSQEALKGKLRKGVQPAHNEMPDAPAPRPEPESADGGDLPF